VGSLLLRLPLLRSAAPGAAEAVAPPDAGLAPASRIRNVAIIAHVDHGKTTLMDRLLRHCGAAVPQERAMDSIELKRERGITIASKVQHAPGGTQQQQDRPHRT